MEGFIYKPGYFNRQKQRDLIKLTETIIAHAPLFQPVMPRTSRPFSVAMTNAGPLGWVSDKSGYRYQPHHPATGRPWPDIPEALATLWRDVCGPSCPPPECCLINAYAQPHARMGLHVDNDEQDLTQPVLSLSLGDDATFRLGGPRRKDPTRSMVLKSGDVIVLSGVARQAHHGIDRIKWGTSDLLEKGGRFNLTLRRVTPPQ